MTHKIYNHRAPDSHDKTIEVMKSLKPGESIWHKQDGRRLFPDKPAFTLRAGCRHLSCGYIVHPSQPRMLTVRECCRFQSFPDWFEMEGTAVEQFKQIGNAVPPLVAFSIASEIRKRLKKNKPSMVDLFSGCGGFSVGFQQAGFSILLGLDSDFHCARTFRKNFPEAAFINGDARKIDSGMLKHTVRSRNIDVVVGGVPCQGFSLAGKRDPSDPRSYLFEDFLRLSLPLKPSFIVLENVGGIRSMKLRGKSVTESIANALRQNGYKVTIALLDATEYGVPQQRKRVFFVGTNLGEEFRFPTPIYSDTSMSLKKTKKIIAAEDAISDLPSLGAGEGSEEMTSNTKAANDFQRIMRGEMKFEDIIDK